LATGFVFIDGDAYVSRPIRGSFAVVDVGRPDIPILRDRRRVGVTGLRGRLLITDLRANQANSIAVALDDLPFGPAPARESIEVAPPARSGVVVRFDLGVGQSGALSRGRRRPRVSHQRRRRRRAGGRGPLPGFRRAR
jgi:outer membrane usher protein